MKTLLKLFVLICIFNIQNLFSQESILNTYFKGNKDSMRVEAYKLIEMPNPVFEEKQNNIELKKVLKKIKSKKNIFYINENTKLYSYKILSKSDNSIILIHGVASNASEYLETAEQLQKSTNCNIYAIDLRGHGKSDGKFGEVDYINQYTDDLEKIINQIKLDKPKGKIYIASHSMGGGIAFQYALLKKSNNIDGYIFLAPLLGQNSPAIKQGTSSSDSNYSSAMQINIPRIIGLKMLNELGIHEKDNLPVLFFKLPNEKEIISYSYTANMSMAPENYLDGLKALNKPAIFIIGSNDEAFDAQIMQKVINENTKAEIDIVANENHETIKIATETFSLIKRWFEKYGRR